MPELIRPLPKRDGIRAAEVGGCPITEGLVKAKGSGGLSPLLNLVFDVPKACCRGLSNRGC